MLRYSVDHSVADGLDCGSCCGHSVSHDLTPVVNRTRSKQALTIDLLRCHMADVNTWNMAMTQTVDVSEAVRANLGKKTPTFSKL